MSIITDSVKRSQSVKLFSNQVSKDIVNNLSEYKYSNSSTLAMTSDWNRFVSFCEAKHVRPLPTSITAIRLFLEHESKQRKFSSLKRYSITIANIHQWHGFPSPTNHRQIKFTLQSLRLMKHGDETQASPMTKLHLKELSSLLNGSPSPRNIRDLSIYYVMFECALKRSDLKNLQIEDIKIEGKSASINLSNTEYVFSDMAAQSLLKWCEQLNGSKGFLYRRIDKHGNIGMEKLNDSSIYRILRSASDKLNLPYQNRFTGQSARVGAAQELDSQGYKLREIQDFGRWLSPAMPAQYLYRTSTAEIEKAKFKIIKPWD